MAKKLVVLVLYIYLIKKKHPSQIPLNTNIHMELCIFLSSIQLMPWGSGLAMVQANSKTVMRHNHPDASEKLSQNTSVCLWLQLSQDTAVCL